MKKLILLACIAVSFASCLQEKSYNCECTYVPSIPPNPVGTANKVETTTVKGRLREDADVNCAFEGKYMTQFYAGTCTLK